MTSLAEVRQDKFLEPLELGSVEVVFIHPPKTDFGNGRCAKVGRNNLS
jgi:hypothetical protein